MPPTAAATIGTRAAIASRSVTGVPSVLEGSAKASKAGRILLDVVAFTEEGRMTRNSEVLGESREGRSFRAVTNDHDEDVDSLAAKPRGGAKEKLMVLVRVQPADRADDQSARWNADLPARLVSARSRPTRSARFRCRCR